MTVSKTPDHFKHTVFRYFGYLALALFVKFISAYILSYLIILLGLVPPEGTTAFFLLNWVFSDLVSYGIPILILGPLLYRKKLSVSSFKGKPDSMTILLFPSLVLTGIIVSTASIWITEWIETASGQELIRDPISEMGPESGFEFFLFAIFVCVLAPVLEEILYRELLFTPLLPYGEYFAIFISAVIFGLVHGNMTQFAYATVVGIFLGFARIKSGSLFVPILLHVINNLIVACSDTVGKLEHPIALGISTAFSLLFVLIVISGIFTFPILISQGYFRRKWISPIPASQKLLLLIKNPFFWISAIILILGFVV